MQSQLRGGSPSRYYFRHSLIILISCSPLTFSYSWETLPYSVDYRETIRNLLSRAATATGKILVYAPRRWILLRCPGALAITYT